MSPTEVVDLRGAQREAWQQEWPYTVQILPLAHLVSDNRYQRDVLEKFVEDKAQEFDPTLVGTIDVSRRSDTQFAILDGLQRSEICKRVGKKSVWCSVYTQMTVSEEAEHFTSKNRERRNMHPYFVIRARKVAGEQGPRDIFRIVQEEGFKLASGGREKKGIVAIAAVEEVYKMRSLVREEGALPLTLKTVDRAFADRDGATEGTVLRAIGRFWQAYADDEVDVKHLMEVLAGVGPKTLVGYATDRVATSRMPKAFLAAQEIVRLYSQGLPRHSKLSSNYLNPLFRDRQRSR